MVAVAWMVIGIDWNWALSMSGASIEVVLWKKMEVVGTIVDVSSVVSGAVAGAV